MTLFTRFEHIKMVKGMLWRYMYAQKSGEPLLVAKLCENGKQVSRNIDYCGMYGWRFSEPGHKYRTYTGYYTAELDKWSDYTPSLANFCWQKPSDNDRETILSKYPEFKWVMQKAEWSIANIFKAIPLWKKDARLMETLCSIGCDILALNGSFYSLKDRWEIVKYLSRNPERKNENLQDIRLNMKGYSWETIETYRSTIYRSNYVNIDEWLYLFPLKYGPTFYRDYKEMCIKAGHDLKDPYWRYPKDLRKAHDKVMRECKNIDRMKREAEMKTKQESYTKAIEKFIGKEISENGIKVFVQDNLKLWNIQAEKLHQCIVASRYDDKVIRGECVIVFITKDDKPYATCELKPRGKKFAIGQFYGNERLKDYKAKPDAVEALKKWARIFKIQIKDAA